MVLSKLYFNIFQVTFGERDGVRIGYAVLAVNGDPVSTSGKVVVPPKVSAAVVEGTDEATPDKLQTVDILDVSFYLFFKFCY